MLTHLVTFPIFLALHETLVRCLGADFAASEVEADVAAGEALRAVLGRAHAALGGAVAVAVLARELQAPVDSSHLGDHDLKEEGV